MVATRLEPIAWHVARWGDVPWSAGSWTALAPGGVPQHRATLGEPIDGRFIVAADATNPVAASMTHGAYDEGLRAARWAIDVVQARRVIVIGAGFAGLGAASALRTAGVDVQVLEARDRIGGRVHTVSLGDGVVADVGAAWLQQHGTNSLARLAKQLGIATVATDFHSPLAAAASGVVGDTDGARARIGETFDLASDDASVADVLSAYLPSLAATDRVTAQHAVDLEIDLENGVPHHLLSARWVLHEPGVGNGDHWLPGGFAQLLHHLAAGVDIRLNSPVRRIEWNFDGVKVGGIAADCCICTIPVWLLPQLGLQPGLPTTHHDALAHLGVGVVEKVVLRFADRWWPHNSNGYMCWYDSPAAWGEWLDLTDHVGAPVVVGLIAGDAVTRHHRGHTDEQVAITSANALRSWSDGVTGSRARR